MKQINLILNKKIHSFFENNNDIYLKFIDKIKKQDYYCNIKKIKKYKNIYVININEYRIIYKFDNNKITIIEKMI